MLQIDQAARRLIDAGERDADVLARKVAQEVISAGEAEELIAVLLRSRFQTMIRAVVRAAEQKYDTANRESKAAERRGDKRSDYANEATKARQELLRERFFAPGFGWVVWGSALAVHHRAARDHAFSIAAGHTADGERHDRALRDIEAAGATCLDELGESEDDIRKRIAA